MISYETHVLPNSDYYVYTPSTLAEKLFFYPICTGSFCYESGYHLQRESYDSFLLMYLLNGACQVTVGDVSMQAAAGQLVFLDCYAPHAYSTDSGFEALWLHFDGPLARTYYEAIVSEKDALLYPSQPEMFRKHLYEIYDTFRSKKSIAEDALSASITEVLNDLLTADVIPQTARKSPASVSDAVLHINKYFYKPITLKELADIAALSPYYFSRVFAKETGMTPHRYLMSTRMANAKFLLKTSQMSVKEIAFRSGFTDESGFCTAFKKQEGKTPKEYRHSNC
ncbi:MAG: AraC family transcriptional regulator [Lachnospiraceae bacterium]|nr:AraC family transcriptional regulator [Lachnospiraceae bacterium]